MGKLHERECKCSCHNWWHGITDNPTSNGRQRIDLTLDDYTRQNPELKPEELVQLQKKFSRLWATPSLSIYSQRLRRLREAYEDDPIISKRLKILQDQRFLCTDYLKFPQASSFLAPLERSMRFLDEKLQTFGQFRAKEKVNATLNTWAIINKLRTFLPNAKQAGKFQVEVFGAKLRGIL